MTAPPSIHAGRVGRSLVDIRSSPSGRALFDHEPVGEQFEATDRSDSRFIIVVPKCCGKGFLDLFRAARLLAGCFVAHRSKTTAGILPLRFAHPAKIRSSAVALLAVSLERPARRSGPTALARKRKMGRHGVRPSPGLI